MPLDLASYVTQRAGWPAAGRHIMAQYDDDSVIVYQAYRPEIGRYAATHQRFGGDWSLSRMSWIKPNFLWMMFRAGWATKPGQEVILAVRLRRAAFDEILAHAVHSSFVPDVYESRTAWRARLAASSVRLQWDPDHDPYGAKEARRAIQLGLRGPTLARYADDWLLAIEDISDLVREQHAHVVAKQLARLTTPAERPYPVTDPAVAAHLGVDRH